MKNKKRQYVRIDITNNNNDYDYVKFNSFLEDMNKYMNEIPEEYKKEAYFEIEKFSEYESEYIGINIYYYRLETYEELEYRIRSYDDKKRKNELEERVLYEKLKKKYGDNS